MGRRLGLPPLQPLTTAYTLSLDTPEKMGKAAAVDLDGPLLLARDRCPGLRYAGSLLHPPAPELWG